MDAVVNPQELFSLHSGAETTIDDMSVLSRELEQYKCKLENAQETIQSEILEHKSRSAEIKQALESSRLQVGHGLYI